MGQTSARRGVDALRHRPPHGAKSKLNPEQLAELPKLMARGAEAYGFRGNVWNHPRITAVIRQELGVKYHPNHIPRILHKIGWSRQKPHRRATQRDETAIVRWREEDWPRLMKEATEAGKTIIFTDETGFRLLPAVVHTYAPRGQTPVLDVPLSYDHLSVMGAVTLDGSLLTWIQDRSVKGEDVVRFLKHVLAAIPGEILLIWDNLPGTGGELSRNFWLKEPPSV